MTISSRTPEGWHYRCRICGKRFCLFPSQPTEDVPCPNCGSLARVRASRKRRQTASLPRVQLPLSGELTLSKYRDVFHQIVSGKLPVASFRRHPAEAEVADPQVKELLREAAHIQGMVDSMTFAERETPDLIDPSRLQRIAGGAGLLSGEVERLIKNFLLMRKMLRLMGSRDS